MGKIKLGEYIIVNSDIERDELLDFFDSKEIKWYNGQYPHNYIPNLEYPYTFTYHIRDGIGWSSIRDDMDTIIEYTDFKERRDSNYSLYGYEDTIILLHYNGNYTFIGDYPKVISRVKLLLLFNNIEELEYLDSYHLNRGDNTLMMNPVTKSIVFGHKGSNKASLITSDRIHKITLDKETLSQTMEWVEIDKVIFQ